MAFQFITRQTQDFDTAFCEFVDQHSHFAQLGSADRCEIRGMGKQNAPSKLKINLILKLYKINIDV